MLDNIRLRYLVGVVFGVVALSFTGCSKDDYNSVPSTNGNGDTTEPKVDGRVVTAYCTWYGSTLPDPQYVTNINYAFAEVYVASGVYKGFKLEGQESRFQNVVNLKKLNPSLKIMISFTHVVENSDNSQGGSFSAIAANADYRKQFAEDCLAFIKKWGIDGIDMDWEFPGLSWSGAACDPANDVANFTLLMKQLRETLGNNYLLTFAGYVMDKKPVAGGYQYIDIAAVMPYVDYVNIMTYDMDAAPKYQSALNDPSSYWDCQRAVNAYINAGAPFSKLLLGIPFYGRHTFSDKTINYKDILTLDKGVYKIDNWDAGANVPYVTKNGQMYYSYDNAKSIAIKGAWIIGLGMKGMCYWDCSGDDGEETLTKAVWNATMKH
ncbi:MAG: glycoside hydrolase family 18 [Bacteroidales bacterium]|nr:glycoside hydrolase family 18 [Bacteroidales bacterium]